MTAKKPRKKKKGKLSLKQLVECICPRCRKIHKRFMFWTGEFTPRVFCNNGASGCNIIAEETYELETHEVNTDTEIVSTLLEFA